MAKVLILSERRFANASILFLNGGAPGSKILLICSSAVVIVNPTSASFDLFSVSMSLRAREDLG
ncbi:MAG: hypothetical protein AB1478_08335 [Nitrospirota bacterium]